MKRYFYLFIVSILLLLACKPDGQKISYDNSLKMDSDYSEYFSIYDEYLKPYIVSETFDTAKLFRYYLPEYNDNCKLFAYSDSKPVDYFGHCECEKLNDSIEIKFSIPGTPTNYYSEIRIRLQDSYAKSYFDKYDYSEEKGLYNHKKVNILSTNLVLSEKLKKIGDKAIGDIIIVTNSDTIKGHFKCIVDDHKINRIKDFNTVEFASEQEIYDFMNQAYLKVCRDTADFRKIFEFPPTVGISNALLYFKAYLKEIEMYTDEEIDYFKEQLPEINKGDFYNTDTTWQWDERRLKNVRIISNQEIQEVIDHKGSFMYDLKKTKERFQNGIVYVSKPIISNDRKIMIIFEQFTNFGFSGTGKSRAFMFKKVSDEWIMLSFTTF